MAQLTTDDTMDEETAQNAIALAFCSKRLSSEYVVKTNKKLSHVAVLGLRFALGNNFGFAPPPLGTSPDADPGQPPSPRHPFSRHLDNLALHGKGPSES